MQDESLRLATDVLASLIVDALVDAKFIRKEEVQEAITIVSEEINVRKVVGDY